MRCCAKGCNTVSVPSFRKCMKHGGGNRCIVESCGRATRPSSCFCGSHRRSFVSYECLLNPAEYENELSREGVNLNAFGRKNTRCLTKFSKIVDEKFARWTMEKRAEKLNYFTQFEEMKQRIT